MYACSLKNCIAHSSIDHPNATYCIEGFVVKKNFTYIDVQYFYILYNYAFKLLCTIYGKIFKGENFFTTKNLWSLLRLNCLRLRNMYVALILHQNIDWKAFVVKIFPLENLLHTVFGKFLIQKKYFII